MSRLTAWCLIAVVTLISPFTALAGSGRVETLADLRGWIPVYVTVETGELATGARYVRTTAIWSDVSGFDTRSTFELEFLLDDYDASPLGPGTYLDRSRSLDQTPKVVTWKSNLPDAYLDTRLGDGNEEIAYTIGSGNASAIEAGVTYSSLIVTEPGDTERDSARLSAQLGVQRPQGCTSTWCSFDAGPGSIVELIPAWEVPVPGNATYGVDPAQR